MVTTTRTLTTTVQSAPQSPAPPERGTAQVVSLGMLIFCFWLLPDDILATLEPKTELGALALEIFDQPRLFLAFLILFNCWKILGTIIRSVSWSRVNDTLTFFSFDPFSSVNSSSASKDEDIADLGYALNVKGRPVVNIIIIISLGVISLILGFMLHLIAIALLLFISIFESIQYLWYNVDLTGLRSWPIDYLSWIFLFLISIIFLRLVLLSCLLWPHPSKERAEEIINRRKSRRLKQLEVPIREVYEKCKSAAAQLKGDARRAAWADYEAFKEKHGVFLATDGTVQWMKTED